MSVENYKPNSHKYREEQKADGEKKKVEKVVTGAVRVKKKSGIRALANTIAPGDPDRVRSVMVDDVVIPSIKNMIEDLIVKGIRMLLRGETTSRSDRSTAQYVSYNKMSDRGYYRRPVDNSRTKINRSYEDYSFESRGDAEAVLFRMREMLETYGLVSIADYCDTAGISHNYTHVKYGWTNLDTARIVSDRDGYYIELPKAIPLN